MCNVQLLTNVINIFIRIVGLKFTKKSKIKINKKTLKKCQIDTIRPMRRKSFNNSLFSKSDKKKQKNIHNL
ncbi:hypothetical protein BpHYR1_004594 [Brachionus plicatilis]|uniref:Uncharacterized protein n=1 Tax=Brachionus plicatilis TaxID=10195 RepID=A0A3M7PB46_BRAPC|nr:hypothetical protein BpHYR1_004594 [Brachionus plicatilis]